MRTILLLLTALLVSCAHIRLGSDYAPTGKVNYKLRNFEFTKKVNGEKVDFSQAIFGDYERNYHFDYLTKEVLNNSGEEIDIEVTIDNEVPENLKLNVTIDGERKKMTLDEIWFYSSVFTLTVLPYWDMSKFTANVEVSKNDQLICEKSCPGEYVSIMFAPLVFVTPISFYHNKNKFKKELAGACLQQCLSENAVARLQLLK
jgi:hypothetical protein